MIYKSKKYNFSESEIKKDVNEIYKIIKDLKVHLKGSDKRGKKNNFIFDPKGTNEEIKKELIKKNWISNLKIPDNFNPLGKGIDFFKNGIIVEVQFSNYPFLLNNVIRSELFYKNSKILTKKIECLIIITKVRAFPSSNSTLYFEQAENQLDLLSDNNLFSIPIILLGLNSEINKKQKIIWSKYKEARYSRESVDKKILDLEVKLKNPKSFFSFK